MSGIGAILSLDNTPLTMREWLPMAGSLERYGRDGQRIWKPDAAPLVLMHSLFAITPHDHHMAGASVSPDEHWILMGDVRLDAREELACALGTSRETAGAMTDEQLVALAFGRWNEAAAEHLLGGFAVIAWNLPEHRLHLLVDPSGEKQLYFCRRPARFFISNRAPPLLVTPGVERRVDVAALLDFFTDQLKPWQTTLAGIEAIPPGSRLTLDLSGACTRTRWWSPPQLDAWKGVRFDDPVERFRHVFESAVADRLRCSGVHGGFCSGGLDSTAVSAVAARLLAQRGLRYRTYTSVPHPDWREAPRSPSWEDDERPYVSSLARARSNMVPTFVAVNGTVFLDCLPALFADSAWPVRNTSNMPWLFAIWNLMSADGIRAPLSGNRGNFTISFDGPVLHDLVAAARFDLLLGEIKADPRSFAASLGTLLIGRAKSWLRRSSRARDAVHTEWLRRIALRPAALNAIARCAHHPGYSHPYSTAGLRRQYQSIHESSMGLTLGVATSEPPLCITDPTADRRVMELCWSLPPTEFRHGRERRRLVRRAMLHEVPDAVRLRTTRGSQAPDFWMHQAARVRDLRAAVEFVVEEPVCRELLDVDALRAWLEHLPLQYHSPLHASQIPLQRALSMGLYLRWINGGLTDLPGARKPADPIIEIP